MFDASASEHPRYNAKTSNTMESVWGRLLEQRELDHMGFLHACYLDVAEKMFNRKSERIRHPRFTDHWYGVFLVELDESRLFLSTPFSDNEGIVHLGEANSYSSFRVNTLTRTCSCIKWQDTRIPCRHAICFMRDRRVDPEAFIDPVFSVASYRQAYSGSLKAVSLSDLVPDDTLPPRHQPAREEWHVG